MKFTDHIEDIDFDGAQLKSIVRAGYVVTLIFDNCMLFTRHPNSSKFKEKINGLSIIFSGVTEERALKYVGVGKSEPYCGEKPIENVETFCVNGTIYEFGGYVGGELWYEWAFHSDGYEGSF
jgi:hypothetical protein